MDAVLVEHEASIRLLASLGIFVPMALWEWLAPRRAPSLPRPVRWLNNLGLAVLDTVLVRITLPILAVGMALLAEARGWGVLNLVALPGWLAFLLAVLALDAAIYGQHVLFHLVPPLWRLHRTHHTDVDFDVTTGIRFHPLEILLSMVLKLALVALLGAPAAAVIVFEVLLHGTSLFNHGNVRIPAGLERRLRLIVVTPEMHRVHHSVYRDETDSNFGFNLPWWDRLFGTYRAQPRDGHEAMAIGIETFREPREQWVDRLLIQPFVTRPAPPAREGGHRAG